jgi:hypothetical protein
MRNLFQETHASFKNFHRSLCARFGYVHDDRDWQRDQVSLEEHIAGQLNDLKAKTEKWCGYGDNHRMHTFYGNAEAITELGNVICAVEGFREALMTILDSSSDGAARKCASDALAVHKQIWANTRRTDETSGEGLDEQINDRDH